MQMQFSDVLTIHAAAERCKAENMPVSEKALRRWVNDGTLPAAHSGRKAFLYFPNIMQLIQSGAARAHGTYSITE